MGSDAAEEAEIIASSFKVHQAMCEELMKLVNRTSSLLPQIEEARPRGSSGMQALCSLNEAIEKAKLLLQHCSEASKFYLVYTADAILSRCERMRKMLELSFVQIQNDVPVLLAIEISRFIDDIRSATFTLDLADEEAGKFVRRLVNRGASESSEGENFELNAFQSAALRLHITSPKDILVEKRSIRKLLNKVGNTDPKKKKILTYFFYLVKQHGNQLPAEQAKTLNMGSDVLISNGNVRRDPESRRSARVESTAGPSDALSDPMLLKEFKCPLSSRIMYDPVVIASGQTYERVWIEKWFDEGHDTCPKTKVKLDNLFVTPNTKMKDLISRWCMKHGVSIPNPGAELQIEAMPSLDHSSSSFASIGSSINDFHLHVDLSSVSIGSLDTSFSADSAIHRIMNGSATMPMRVSENNRRKSFETLGKLSELPWPSQCELVEDFRHRLEQNCQALVSVSSENYLSPILRFLEEAINRGDVKAQRIGSQLLLAYIKKCRHGAKNRTDELFSVLVALLNSSEEVKKEALAIVETLSCEPDCRANLAASGALAVISDDLCSQSRDLQGSALRILQNLSSDNDTRILIVSIDSIVPKLVPFLKDAKLSVLSLFILQSLCHIEAAKLSIVGTSGCIASIAELLDTGNKEAQEIALSIFLTLCSQRIEYCQLILDEGFNVIPAIVSISINGTEKAKVISGELRRLLTDVNIDLHSPHDSSYRSDSIPTQFKDPDEQHRKENRKSSSSRPSGFLGMFSRARR